VQKYSSHIYVYADSVFLCQTNALALRTSCSSLVTEADNHVLRIKLRAPLTKHCLRGAKSNTSCINCKMKSHRNKQHPHTILHHMSPASLEFMPAAHIPYSPLEWKRAVELFALKRETRLIWRLQKTQDFIQIDSKIHESAWK
jgi:hypothetical protein